MIAKTGFRMRGRVPRCLPSSGVDNFSEHFPCSGCEKKNPRFSNGNATFVFSLSKGRHSGLLSDLSPADLLSSASSFGCVTPELVPGRTLGPEDAS